MSSAILANDASQAASKGERQVSSDESPPSSTAASAFQTVVPSMASSGRRPVDSASSPPHSSSPPSDSPSPPPPSIPGPPLPGGVTAVAAAAAASSATEASAARLRAGMPAGVSSSAVQDGTKTFDWPAHATYDERRQLLGTEEESSERPSSDEEEDLDDKDPWTITPEQTTYYTANFLTMQPNPRGSIPGSLAKEFFEKSRLPISELRKIWQLSDVTKDGCLNLEEFLTAMHLVVLRRNDIELPDELPARLQPAALRDKVRKHSRELYEEGGEPLLDTTDGSVGTNLAPDGGGMADDDDDSVGESNSRVPTTTAPAALSPGSLSSPGPKPVNFDFHRPDARRNPGLVQPVPLRLSPESPVIATSEEEDNRVGKAAAPVNVRQGRREVVYEQLWNQEDAASAAEESLSSLTLRGDDNTAATTTMTSSKAGRRSRDDADSTDGDLEDDDNCSTEIDGLQDLSPSPPPVGPLPKDAVTKSQKPSHAVTAHSASLPHFSNALYRDRRQQQRSPPPPPPRTHSRSSSLDLNQAAAAAANKPALPPREPAGALSSSSVGRIAEEGGAGDHDERRSLQMQIHRLREKNSMVARTINELHQEVSDTLEERIALEFHLEQLKSFGD